MCSIAGIISDRPDKLEKLKAMLEALRHRGPDGAGELHEQSIALGHSRLSIIDLEGGQQPLTNADQSLWLVCNGEIYNYRELRAELEAGGYPLKTHSDSEVILGLYERHGDRLLDRLRGMFAFALWDTKRRRLLAARDHLGQKPFYYAWTRHGFAFASEIKGLLAYEPSLRQVDLQALDQYFALRLIAPPRSMFRGISKLPPAHYLVLEQGSEPQVASYWDLSYQPKHSGSEADLTDELEDRIVEALRLHLVSDVRVGAFLSGGLDSSLVVSLLTRRVGVHELPTFTVGLPYEQFDEAPYARAVARLCGTEHHEETLPSSPLASLPEVIFHLDEPSDPLSVCTYHLAKLARRHVKVAIGGDGGDELFGGYDRYYGNLYAQHYARVPAGLRRYVLGPALSHIPESGWYKSAGHQLKWLHRLSFLEGGERYAASLNYFYFEPEVRRCLFAPQIAAQLQSWRPEDAIRFPFEAIDGDPVDRMLYADSKVRLPDHAVMITDRMSMAHGLETRSPFMDHRLVEFVARLPTRMKIRGRSLRCIERKLAGRYLPGQILDRPKQGFSSALPYMLRDQYRVLYGRLLACSQLVRNEVLLREPVEALLRAHLAGKADHGNRLWLLINAELWYRMLVLCESPEAIRSELTTDSPARITDAGPAQTPILSPAQTNKRLPSATVGE